MDMPIRFQECTYCANLNSVQIFDIFPSLLPCTSIEDAGTGKAPRKLANAFNSPVPIQNVSYTV